ncbi:MAG: DUF2788 domain-containing protein [Ketobacter sp.]|uniref:DUF2788 domain-containing protein n=1 Tax=Ketobacter sp. MCCC 1A13808 TaxID=2602738 RepID=UPI001E51054D|nr:DUF2788 domain-containing protein [Ketobacter sp. MCCC 1A13808]
MNSVMGLSEQQVATFGLTIGLAAFILYMVFIVARLAIDSKAGKFGTFVLFLVLTLGMVGFVAKYIIQWALHI